jgi:hypothetical protein
MLNYKPEKIKSSEPAFYYYVMCSLFKKYNLPISYNHSS